MALVSAIFGYMRIVDNELQNAAAEPDEARSLAAVNIAQDLLEDVLATFPRARMTTSQIQTTAATETTDWPATLRRLDGVQPLDGSGGRPIGAVIVPTLETGGHAPSTTWPLLVSVGADGRPWQYWTDESKFYWQTRPDAVYFYRVYGLHAVADYTAQANTFGYPDSFLFPMASIAARVLKIGLGDNTDDLFDVAQTAFAPAIRALRKRSRVRPSARFYVDDHTT